jgi:hypothetical protein
MVFILKIPFVTVISSIDLINPNANLFLVNCIVNDSVAVLDTI